MKKEMRRCKHCGCFFEVCRKVKKHEYCRKVKCQRARKAAAQKCRMAEDPQYKKEQYTAQKDWFSNHPEYWKNYRSKNPTCTERNRKLQRKRNQRRKVPQSGSANKDKIAKMDALSLKNELFSGRYKMLPMAPSPIAKMTPIIVEIDVIKGTCRI